MNSRILTVGATLTIICCSTVQAAEPRFMFVADGQAKCAFVASAGVKHEDLDFFTNAVFRCTGARMPIVEKVEVEGGGGQWNSISFSVEKRPILMDSAYEVAFPDARTMRITGSDNSVRWALNRILEERFGVCFCLPGPNGTHYPAAKTVTMPAVGWQDKAAYQLGYETLGSVDPRYQRSINAGGRTVSSSHMLRTIYADPKYKEPEWVAKLMPLINGERKYPTNIVRLWEPCFACKEGIDEAVNFILDWMKKNPETTSFSLGVNDCGGFCECDGCRAMNGGSVTEKCRFDKNYPCFSNAYGRWCNAIAERVCKVYPDLMLGFLAYRELIDPPDVKLHPNLVPSLCIETLQRVDPATLARYTALFDAWSEKASHIGVYDYAYGSSYRVPRMYSRLFRDFIALKLTKNPQFNGYMCEYGNPWHEGPKLYTQFKLLWDPAQDLGKLQDAWCRACGGEEAAPYLKKIYDLWEEFWMGEEVKKTQWYTGTVGKVYFWFTWQQYCYAIEAERLKRISTCIDKAVAATERNGNDDQKARMRELAVWLRQSVATALACGAGAVTNPLGELANADDVAFFEKNFPRMQKAELTYRRLYDELTDLIERQADGWKDTPVWRASLAWRFRRVERFSWAQNRMRLIGQYLSFKNGAADPIGKNYVPADAQPEATDATVEKVPLGGGKTGWMVTATGAKPSVKVVLAGDEREREYFFTTRIRNLSGHALVYKQTADARMPRNGRMLNVPFSGSGKAKKDETAVLNSIYTKYQTFFSETTEIVATVEFNNLGAGESAVIEEVAFRLPSKTALKLNTPYTAPVKPGKEKLDMTTFEERQTLEEGK